MFNFKPAVREKTPLIIGIAGPTKSGKTYSAHRLAQGIANGGTVAMVNAEGARGHQYADKFKYVTCDIEQPFSTERYIEAIQALKQLAPACAIIDSMSHMHDGPGGMLEAHDKELDRMAGDDYKKRDRMNFTAWIKPKGGENKFIYQMLGLSCPVILCFRAKEKLKIVPGKDPIDLGWQPISSDRIAFETIFTLLLPPHCKGVPDLALSEMREPFDSMVPPGKQIDEALGRQLAAWSAGVSKESAAQASTTGVPSSSTGGEPGAVGTNDAIAAQLDYITPDQVATLETLCQDAGIPVAKLKSKAAVERLSLIKSADYVRAVAWIKAATP